MRKKRRHIRKIGEAIKRVSHPGITGVAGLGIGGALIGTIFGVRQKQRFYTDLAGDPMPIHDDEPPKIEEPKKRKFLEEEGSYEPRS